MHSSISQWLSSILLGLTAAGASAQSPAVPTARVPLHFVENGGQLDGEAVLYAQRGGIAMAVAADGFAVRYAILEDSPPAEATFSRGLSANARVRGGTLRFRFEGASPDATVLGVRELPGRTHYLIGPRSQWHTDLKSYGAAKIVGIRPGVDLDLYESSGLLKYDLTVAPGVDCEAVVMLCEGAEALSVGADGALVARTPFGEVRQPKPVTFERDSAGETRPVEASFRLLGGNRFAIAAPARDAARTLVIDPGIVYSTLIPGSGVDTGFDCAAGAAGNCYVTGFTFSTNFAVKAGSFDVSANGFVDAYCFKLNAAGTGFEYATYLGGQSTDQGIGVAVDSTGAAYVAGATLSTNFPVVPGSYDTSFTGGQQYGDVFVVKLNPAGSNLVYGTLLGGQLDEVALRIAVDNAGKAHVTGWTRSGEFPTTANAFDRTYNGTISNSLGDAFVTRLNAAGTQLDYSTFLGSSEPDAGAGITVANDETIFVTGIAGSGFPVSANAFDKTYNGFSDAFVARINPLMSGNASIVYCTYLGGGGFDTGYGITLDGDKNAYVCGQTFSGGSTSFPVTMVALDKVYNGNGDAFVTKLNSAGTSLVYSTFLGSTGTDAANSIRVDSGGAAFLAGRTSSAAFPKVVGAFDSSYGGAQDGFVSKLNAGGSVLLSSSFVGGAGKDEAFGLSLLTTDEVFVSGTTQSADFKTTAGVVDTVLSGQDAFVMRVNLGPVPVLALAELKNTDKTDDTVVIEYEVGEATPVIVNRTIQNLGSPTSVLSWIVEELTDAPWLAQTPDQGQVVAEEAGQTVVLAADPTGLAVGPFTTTLRFTNEDETTQKIDVPVLLTVQEGTVADFVVGDSLNGSIAFNGEFDAGRFEGLSGETVTVAVASTVQAETLKPEIRFQDSVGGTTLKTFVLPHSTKVAKRNYKLTSSGTFRLRVTGTSPTTGGYSITTSSKLPANAKPFTKKNAVPKSNGFPVDVLVGLKAGGKLDATVLPTTTITGPLAVALLSPSGTSIDVTAQTQPFGANGLQLVQVPITQTGNHTLRVTGIATKKEKVTIAVTPQLPGVNGPVSLP
ncbi:MAG: SBBP repeat-containing protein [Planctomycetes bacterium]|nr:SBBP repeat-containing protein [Planctomycetota bacterium]